VGLGLGVANMPKKKKRQPVKFPKVLPLSKDNYNQHVYYKTGPNDYTTNGERVAIYKLVEIKKVRVIKTLE
jgi:hypothetical protein